MSSSTGYSVKVCVLCAALTLICSVYVVRTVNASSLADGPPTPRVINAKEPVLMTVKIVRTLQFSGEQLSSNFTYAIRGNGYLVDAEGSRFVLYSAHLNSSELNPGSVVKGWFIHLNTKVATENALVIVPVECISIDHAVKGSKDFTPIQLPKL